jgi:NAD(P)-dependent dehydrogenase (short-subunit alcohol dehydrogenase family)
MHARRWPAFHSRREARVITLVTGVGSKGQVGEVVAATFARRGDRVILVSRSEQEVRARAADLAAAGHTVSAYGCDLSDASAVERLAARVRAEHGERLDALVNLAGGFALSGPMAESDPVATEKQFTINFRTAYLATRAFLPSIRAGRGSIVFFASESVLDGARTNGTAAYAAAKSAVVALMRSVADEGRQWGVRSNAVAPAAIRTAANEASMGQDARYVEREDVAAAVAFLCSPEARAISGQIIRLR